MVVTFTYARFQARFILALIASFLVQRPWQDWP